MYAQSWGSSPGLEIDCRDEGFSQSLQAKRKDNESNCIQLFTIQVSSQQLQGQLQKQHNVDTKNSISKDDKYRKTSHRQN